MKTYLYWIGAVAVVGVGVYLASLVQIQPPTLPKVPFAQFESPEDLGKAVAQSLQLEIKQAPILLLGVTPGAIEDIEFAKGFLETFKDPGLQYQMTVVEPKLPYIDSLTAPMALDIKDDMERFVEGVQKGREQGLRIAVLVPNIYASQLLNGNPVARLKEEFKLEVTSISVAKFPVTKEQEESFEPRCVLPGDGNYAGTGQFGCMIRSLARKTYGAPFANNKYSGTAEKVGPQDYLVLLNRNAGSR